jgi:hypothetical protein
LPDSMHVAHSPSWPLAASCPPPTRHGANHLRGTLDAAPGHFPPVATNRSAKNNQCPQSVQGSVSPCICGCPGRTWTGSPPPDLGYRGLPRGWPGRFFLLIYQQQHYSMADGGSTFPRRCCSIITKRRCKPGGFYAGSCPCWRLLRPPGTSPQRPGEGGWRVASVESPHRSCAGRRCSGLTYRLRRPSFLIVASLRSSPHLYMDSCTGPLRCLRARTSLGGWYVHVLPEGAGSEMTLGSQRCPTQAVDRRALLESFAWRGAGLAGLATAFLAGKPAWADGTTQTKVVSKFKGVRDWGRRAFFPCPSPCST